LWSFPISSFRVLSLTGLVTSIQPLHGQFFSAVFVLFSAVEKGANSLDNLCSIAESESAALAESMSIERTARLDALRAELKVRPRIAA